MFICFAAVIAAYFLGSIPFGLLFSRIFNKGDLRKLGSGNIGATNALRIGGKLVGLLTLFCDVFKGLIPVFIVKIFFPDQFLLIAMVGFAVVIGHIFPIWLNFKGGKGVATTLAVLFVINSWLGFVSVFIWLIVYYIAKTSSVSSLIMMAAIVIIGYKWLPIEYELTFMLLCAIVVFKHKDNIGRLLKGKEDKI